MKKEKLYNLLLIILIFFVILSIILLNPIKNLDELWNYNFARNVANGLVPYRDFNIVVTPLVYIICGIILKITFNELIIMRILAAILCTLIICFTYKIFNILEINKKTSIVFVCFIGYIFKDVLAIDYNYVSLLLTLIIIYRELKSNKQNHFLKKVNLKEEVVLGFLGGLSILTKQTIGLLVCIVLLGNQLLFVRKKEDFIIYLKNACYRLVGIIIPVFIFIVYLFINNAVNDFISYTIKGILEFDNFMSYKTLLKFDLIGILSVLVPITFWYAGIKFMVLEKDKIIYIFLVYGLAMFIICFPISDKNHFLIGALPVIILILYELNNIFRKVNKTFNSKKINTILEFILSFLNCVIILFLIYMGIMNFYRYYKNNHNFSTLNHFKFVRIEKWLEEEVYRIHEYMRENSNIKILDTLAVLYMIPADKYNKDYDMFNKGNLGYNGEMRIINEIRDSKDTIYLIKKDGLGKHWQLPLAVINYVKKNKTKIDELEKFDIYQ